MAIAIDFRNVSKFFRMDRERRRTFQQMFVSLLHKPSQADGREVFWALRDVSFTIERGDSVGLVGTNGAGKSTALKLISKIILPSNGDVLVNGRVTALLELGAGFHPDLSGRDNVYLNGAVMGLSHRQVDERLEQIIDFAEISDFIDVPVKDYSSGMFARLGFSVAVHLDPDILLVDEVLSVGDAAFQQKCNERMAELRKTGVTILFVSHSADAVLRACSKAIWLDQGKLKSAGSAQDITDAYNQFSVERAAQRHIAGFDLSDRGGTGEARLIKFELLDENLRPVRNSLTNRPLTMRLHYHARERLEQPLFGLAIHHVLTNTHLAGPNNLMARFDVPAIEGEGFIDYRLDQLPFLPGDYAIMAVIYDITSTHAYDIWINAARLRVVPGGTLETHGLIALEGRWSHRAGASAPAVNVSKVVEVR